MNTHKRFKQGVAYKPSRIRVSLEERAERRPRTCEIIPIESIVVGSCQIRTLHLDGKRSKFTTKIRRVARVRSPVGISRYFLYTEPDKGKMLPFVSHFRRRVFISPEKFKIHFGFEHDTTSFKKENVLSLREFMKQTKK